MGMLIEAVSGKKTYLTALVGIVVAWGSVYLGQMEPSDAFKITYDGLLAVFVRAGVAKLS